MKTHGKLKASITVETALVLPIVFAAMFAVLFLVLLMFQNTIQTAILNMDALHGVNFLTGPYAYVDSGNVYVKGIRDKNGYIIKPSDNISKNSLSIYNLYGDRYVNEKRRSLIEENVDSDLNKVGFLTLNRESISTEMISSVMIRANLTSNQNAILGRDFNIQTSGIASKINPSRYIRETDSKCAILTTRLTKPTEWGSGLETFLAEYLADLFTKGTFPN